MQKRESNDMATNNEAWQSAVKAQINGDKQHGWGQQDSIAVIQAVLCNETGSSAEDLKPLMALIEPLVNPSAFRQKLESQGVLAKSEKKQREKNAIAGLLDGIA